ncbi:MAG: glycosyltransferase family 2 protein [Planctomycetota bacterium]|nr:MAG: glycosyltransferase family 2 protein [Planctomycetota bacterium]
MRFSVLVPTFRRPELLRRCLEALALQTRQPDEILVGLRVQEDPEGVRTVDDFVAAHPELTLIRVVIEKPGVVHAENRLLAAAGGDVACFLDDDAIARPFWLENLARHYEREELIGGVAGPAIDVVDGTPRRRPARHRNRVIFPGLILDQSTRHSDRPVRVDHFRGANMSLRLEPLRRLGGFDERLLGDGFRFELDACLGLARLGYRLVFDPEVEVDHHEAPRRGNTARAGAETLANNAANETFVLLKHWGRGPAGWLHLVFALLVGNFPCPGLAWALAGAAIGLFRPHRHLHGLRGLLPSWRGRLRGWRMATERAREARTAPA